MDEVILKIEGMHCTSCAFNIDGELEDTDGVCESLTNYAKSETKVFFEKNKISETVIIEIIEKVGYKAKKIK